MPVARQAEQEIEQLSLVTLEQDAKFLNISFPHGQHQRLIAWLIRGSLFHCVSGHL